MPLFLLISLLCLLPIFRAATAFSTENVALRARNGPGMTDKDTFHALGRAFSKARLQSRDIAYQMNKTSIEKSWTNAVLYQGDSSSDLEPTIEITCSTCYVIGSVSGKLTFADSFNSTTAIDAIEGEAHTIAEEAWTYIKSDYDDLMSEDHNYSVPTLDLDFNLDNITGFTDVHLQFEFDDLEFYFDLDTKLPGGTWIINIFTSETPAGFSDLKLGLQVGAIFSVDLILIADAEIEIGSGIHIKLDDGVTFDLEMFKNDVSSIHIPGGHYEFLPLTIKVNGGYLRAVLRLQASLGIELSLPNDPSVLKDDIRVGVEADVFAYVADFMMRVDDTSTAETDDCDLSADLEYTLAVGAAAGATVGVGSHKWGPTAESTVPIWYTTLASTCVKSEATSTPSASVSAQITARENVVKGVDDLIGDDGSTTSTRTETYTIVACSSSGLVNCPVSLQTTSVQIATVTSILTVQSGSTASFAVNTQSSVTSTIPFGHNSAKLTATSGAPTSYTPLATGRHSTLDGGTGTSNKLIIGLCVGLGVPFLAALIIGSSYLIYRRKQYASLPSEPKVVELESLAPPYDPFLEQMSVSSMPRAYSKASARFIVA